MGQRRVASFPEGRPCMTSGPFGERAGGKVEEVREVALSYSINQLPSTDRGWVKKIQEVADVINR